MMISRTHSHTLSIAGLVLILALGSYGQKRETIQAQAFGQGPASGRSFGVTILIEDYSTPADQKALIDAFKRGGHDEMIKVLSKMKSKGRVRLSSGGVGYEIVYIRNIPTANGRTIRLLTDRPINFGEAYANTRSRDYDLSVIELQLSNGDKSKGTLMPAVRVMVNKKKQQIELETLNTMPYRLAAIMQR
jgi:hypothetical protein